MKTFRWLLAISFLAFGFMTAQVFAVDEETAGGAATGGVIGGAVGGPIGAGVGAAIGGAAGSLKDDDDERRDADVPDHHHGTSDHHDTPDHHHMMDDHADQDSHRDRDRSGIGPDIDLDVDPVPDEVIR